MVRNRNEFSTEKYICIDSIFGENLGGAKGWLKLSLGRYCFGEKYMPFACEQVRDE